MSHKWELVDRGSHNEWQCTKCSATHKNIASWMFHFVSDKPPNEAKIWVGGGNHMTCDELMVAQIHKS